MERKKKKNRNTSRDYVNNKRLYEELKIHFQDVKDAEESGDDKPPIPDYIAECIVDISKNLSYKRNFKNYPFREELVGDGMEEGIRRLYNFNPDKYDNPFAYFTRVIYFAMVRRIQKEKKELYIKLKVTENTLVMGSGAENYTQSDGLAEMTFLDSDTDYMNEYVQDYEDSMKKRKEKKKQRELDNESSDT